MKRLPFLGVAILTATSLCLAGNDNKIAKDLGATDQQAKDVIIQFRHAPGAQDHAKVKASGGTYKSTLGLVNSAVYSIAPGQLKKLADDPDVVFISPDRDLKPTLDLTAATVGSNVAAQHGYTGTGVGVAVLDSGVYQPTILGSSVVYTKNFTTAASSGDWYGHGTHVAGILAANGPNSPYKGLSPGVRLISLKVLDDNGAGKDSWVIAAIAHAISIKSTYNIRVMNLSLGRPVAESYATDPLCQAVESPGRPALSWWWRPVTRAATTRRVPTATLPLHPPVTTPM